MKIFIVGMHRSGTSMITGILHKCGLELGDNLLMNAKDNPKGHFENRRFIRINQEILIRNGGRWFNPPENIRFHPGLKNKMRQFLNQFEPQKITGFKDPRVCLTLPLWREVIHPEPIKAVVVVRPFSAIAKSLQRRNGFNLGKGERLADHYVRSAFATLNKFDIPYVVTLYHRYFRVYKGKVINNWKSEVEPVLKFTGLKLPEDTAAIDKFVDGSLWHNRR
jgi:hypothetical protein